MFGLDLWEILIILVVAVIFINPKDMPRFFRGIGKLYGQWRSLTFSLNRTIKTAIQEETERALNQLTTPTGSADTVPEPKPALSAITQEADNTPTQPELISKTVKTDKRKPPATDAILKKKRAAGSGKKTLPQKGGNIPRKPSNIKSKKKGAQS